MYDATTPLGEFIEAAAARKPTPGGGSVTALVGALAAALGEMVLNYSIGKKELSEYETELKPALTEMTHARKLLLQLMIEDQLAYEEVARLRKMKPEESERIEKQPAALLAAIGAPQAMAATAVAVLELCDRIVNFVNIHLLSDLAVCADLAMATARCAIYNVRVNLSEELSASDRREIESSISRVLGNAAVLIQQVSRRIWARHGQNL